MASQDNSLEILDAIQEDELQEALELISKSSADRDILHRVVLLRRRISELENLKMSNQVTQEEYSVSRSRITSDILKLHEIASVHPEEDRDQPKFQDFQLLEDIIFKLDLSHDAYIAQTKLRNILMRELRKRHRIVSVENYYQVFANYYEQMTDLERNYHKTIRGFTENIIKVQNFAVLDILQKNPQLKKLVPELKDLELHLHFWKSKYHSIFEGNPSICLVYVGVEEEVRFPNGIDHVLRKYLAQHSYSI